MNRFRDLSQVTVMIIMLMMATGVGCAHKPMGRSAASIKSAQQPRAMRGLAHLFWSDGQTEYTSLAAVLAAAPDRLRVELLDPALGTWAVVGASGKQAWVWSADEQRVRRGSARSALKKLIGFDETTEQVVEKLLQLRPQQTDVLRISSGKGWLLFHFDDIHVGDDVDAHVFSAESLQQ